MAPNCGADEPESRLLTGEFPAIHPAAMVSIVTFLGLSLLFEKRSADGYVRRNPFRVALEDRPDNVQGQLASQALDRHSFAPSNTSCSDSPMGGDHDACDGHQSIPAIPLRLIADVKIDSSGT